MILVDTSVLVDFFKGVESPTVKKFESILENSIPFGITSIIYQELLQGAKTENEYNLLNEYLTTQTFFHPADEITTYEKAAGIFFNLRRKGVTVRSTIDCLIAQIAVENNLFLLHNDKDYTQICKHFKIREY